MMELELFRREIDRIDEELVRLLNQRASIALQIGEIKARAGLAIYDPDREGQVVERLMQWNGGPMRPADLQSIFTQVMIACRHLQQNNQELA